jgi:hypothetical protein
VSTVILPQPGGCVCGQTRYALNGAPLLAYVCHCHDCQKRSGSAFALSLLVRSADVAVAGATEVIPMTSPSGRQVDHHVCPRCRLRLFGRGPASPDFTTLRAGTLDDTSWIVPIAQIWAESALPWALIPGVRIVSPEAFDFFALGRDWAATAPRFEGPPTWP